MPLFFTSISILSIAKNSDPFFLFSVKDFSKLGSKKFLPPQVLIPVANCLSCLPDSPTLSVTFANSVDETSLSLKGALLVEGFSIEMFRENPLFVARGRKVDILLLLLLLSLLLLLGALYA